MKGHHLDAGLVGQTALHTCQNQSNVQISCSILVTHQVDDVQSHCALIVQIERRYI